MARAIVTQALVNEAADALAAAGEEPAIISVQEKIGGGSYTTVKRFLAAWKTQQEAQPPAIEVPEAIATRGATFVRELWSAAAALAEQHSAQVREEAQRQVEAAQAALVSAEAAIARMESEGEEQAQRLASQEQAITALRDELAQARSASQVAEARAAEQAQRVEDLQQQVQQRDTELAQARAAALDQARLAGEVTALQRQLQEQTALIERLARGKQKAES
jgi:predicted RNase H-like nuclease (RuvC/YqgF family)